MTRKRSIARLMFILRAAAGAATSKSDSSARLHSVAPLAKKLSGRSRFSLPALAIGYSFSRKPLKDYKTPGIRGFFL
jgi:hypothetical protein